MKTHNYCIFYYINHYIIDKKSNNYKKCVIFFKNIGNWENIIIKIFNFYIIIKFDIIAYFSLSKYKVIIIIFIVFS